jgi:hypothetical protein
MRQGLIVALALSCAGCNVVATKAYDGPSRAGSELSLLKAGATGQEGSPVSLVDLRIIDGKAQRAGTYLASVLPGRHHVGLSETLRIGTRDRVQYCGFEIDTVAGCTYQPTAPSTPTDATRGPWEWSVDMVVVAECERDGGFALRVPARCGSTGKVFERIAR